MGRTYPPLLLKYLKQFQEDPTSKIFAPLAESYRKIGLIDEAIEICKEGLEANPDFVGGKVALARAYFDKKLFKDVWNITKGIVEISPDNIAAQRLFADAAMQLAHFQDALQAYKMLLYYNPLDNDVANLVRDLETKSFNSNQLSNDKLKKVLKLQKMLNRVKEMRGSEL
jgi:tetratricopeptide (TPR) repeat protein